MDQTWRREGYCPMCIPRSVSLCLVPGLTEIGTMAVTAPDGGQSSLQRSMLYDMFSIRSWSGKSVIRT